MSRKYPLWTLAFVFAGCSSPTPPSLKATEYFFKPPPPIHIGPTYSRGTCTLPTPVDFDTNSPPPTTGSCVAHSTSDLKSCLQSATYGTAIVLDSTATFTGPFDLPTNKSGSGWIVIKSDQVDAAGAGFPAAGQRVRKSQQRLLAHIVTPDNGTPAIRANTGAHHYWFIGIDVQPSGPMLPNSPPYYGTLISLGAEGNTNESLQYADHIVLDRVYIHGSTLRDPVQKHVRHGVLMDGTQLAIVNSRLSNLHTAPPPASAQCTGSADSQTIYGGNGVGPFKIDNNYIGGSTEGVAFGGGGFTPVQNPADITVTNNHFYSAPDWQSAYLGKASFEAKVAERLWFAYNYVENSYDNCGGTGNAERDGKAMRLTTRNQDGETPNAVIHDVTVSDNAFINHNSGIGLLGADDGYPSLSQSCVEISNNLFDHIPGSMGSAPGPNDPPDYIRGSVITVVTGGGVTAQGTTWSGGVANLAIHHNTAFNTGYFMLTAPSTNADGSVEYPFSNKGAIIRDNIVDTNGHPYIAGQGKGEGQPTLAYFYKDADVARNDFFNANLSGYAPYCSTDPAQRNDCLADSETSVAFADANAHQDENFTLDSTSPGRDRATETIDLASSLYKGPFVDIGMTNWREDGTLLAYDVVDPERDDPQDCSVCGTDCVDLATDPGNCGGCGVVCAAGSSCGAGSCH